jgi:predicted transcriptional regulator
VAAGIDFKHAKIAERVATEIVVKGLIERDTAGALTLTDRGRAVLRAMLPDL